MWLWRRGKVRGVHLFTELRIQVFFLRELLSSDNGEDSFGVNFLQLKKTVYDKFGLGRLTKIWQAARV